MCYEQDYINVTKAKVLDGSLLTNSCSTSVRAFVILSPTASIATHARTPTSAAVIFLCSFNSRTTSIFIG